MPSPEAHRKQARHNQEVASQLEAVALDWAITAYFYAAAHLVRAYLAEHGYSFRTHGDVDKHLREVVNNKLLSPAAYQAYVNLYRNGLRARYDCEPPEELKAVLETTKACLEVLTAELPL